MQDDRKKIKAKVWRLACNSGPYAKQRYTYLLRYAISMTSWQLRVCFRLPLLGFSLKYFMKKWKKRLCKINTIKRNNDSYYQTLIEKSNMYYTLFRRKTCINLKILWNSRNFYLNIQLLLLIGIYETFIYNSDVADIFLTENIKI